MIPIATTSRIESHLKVGIGGYLVVPILWLFKEVHMCRCTQLQQQSTNFGQRAGLGNSYCNSLASYLAILTVFAFENYYIR